MKNILIVDDDPIIVSIYQDKFQAAGFVVDVATSGLGAVQKLSERAPDAMLLDLSLDDITGVEVLEIVRRNAATRTMPVVVLSNACMGNLLEAARRAGASRYLNKGMCPPDRVVEEVVALLAGVTAPTHTAPSYRPEHALVAPVAMKLPPMPGVGTIEEEQIQAKLRRQLLESIDDRITEAQRTVQKWQETPERFLPTVPPFRQTIRVLASSATLCGLVRLSHLAGAIEALLLEMELDSPKLGASALRSIMQAVELMPVLLRQSMAHSPEVMDSPSILVVDDDPISRQAACAALETVQLRAIAVGDPRRAVALFEENAFDLAFLDVDMPEMDGFTLCDRLHASAINETTPVVFVTSLVDFETRLRSSRCGAADFISKPLVVAEFALKALICLDRSRLFAAV